MLAMLRALPILGQLAAALGVVVLIGGLYVGWHTYVYNKGYNAAIAQIAADDAEAVGLANEARVSVRNCRLSNGVWNTATGNCDRR